MLLNRTTFRYPIDEFPILPSVNTPMPGPIVLTARQLDADPRATRKRLRWIAGCLMQRLRSSMCLLLLVAGPSAAANLDIAPVRIELGTRRAADSVRITSRDLRPMSIQVRAFDWTQRDGEDQLTPALYSR